MAILNWEDIQEVSQDTAEQSIVTMLQTAGFRATSWQRFSVPLTLVKIGAQLWHEGSKIAVFFKNAVFNATSSGEALTRFSASHYDNEREPAVEAQRLITFTCSATEGPHTFDVGEIVISDDDDTTFRNVEGGSVTYPLTIPSGTSVPGILFEAEEAGIGGNVPDESVTTLVTTLAGVTITSDVLEREGVDEESDDRIRERNASKWSTLAGVELIDDRIKNIVLGASASIAVAEVHSENPRGPGTFDVYISGAVETSSEDDVDLAQDALRPYVFADGTALVIAAEEVELDLSGTVYYVSSVGEAAARAAVEDALETFLLTVPLGGFDYSPGPADVIPKNDIEAMIRGAQASGANCVKTLLLNNLSGDAPFDFQVGNFRKVVRGDWAGLSFVPVNN